MNDPFALLGVPRRFDLDLRALEKAHRDLSRTLHPDRFAEASAGERRVALERAASVNEAFRLVRDPIRRAEALFRIGGVAVGETEEPKASPAFLMDVLEQREALAEAREKKDLDAVRRLGEGMAARAKTAESRLAEGLESTNPGSLAALLPLLGELRFYRRFLDEVSAIEEESE